jgi:hypothetical protein
MTNSAPSRQEAGTGPGEQRKRIETLLALKYDAR